MKHTAIFGWVVSAALAILLSFTLAGISTSQPPSCQNPALSAGDQAVLYVPQTGHLDSFVCTSDGSWLDIGPSVVH
jgi:hypothetical protein